MFVHGKPFEPSLMFAVKAGAHPSGALKGLALLLTLPTIIRKGLSGTNDLAYYEHS